MLEFINFVIRSNMEVAVIIPARLASTRFPEKVLSVINDMPMVVHVAKLAMQSNIGKCIVACCSKRLADIVESYGCSAIVTEDASCGTERVWLAAQKMQPIPDIVINLQGDMVLFDPSILRDITANLVEKRADIATPVRKIDVNEYKNDVCVVFNNMEDGITGRALYFSRQKIPCGSSFLYKHIGIYAYTKNSLDMFVAHGRTFLEDVERLEQLRALQCGLNIIAVPVLCKTYSINTKEEYDIFSKHIF